MATPHDVEEEKEEWVPFSKRPEWADVVPLPQDDGLNPVCPIAYTDQFRETMDYFRAIIKLNELSPRALDLTTEAISLNSANYTAWFFRRKLLHVLIPPANSPQAADSPYTWRKELEYLNEMGRASPKNYQVWHHRRIVIENLDDVSQELSFTGEVLEEDAKNYHAWAHRQWVLDTYQVWENELNYVEQLLKLDLENNSAWNQRFFIITKTSGFTPEVIQREINYAFGIVKQKPNNESPWVYLRGIFGRTIPFSQYPQVKETCEEIHKKFVACPHVLSLLIDILEQERNAESTSRALALCETLANSLDVIHQKYWKFKELKLRA